MSDFSWARRRGRREKLTFDFLRGQRGRAVRWTRFLAAGYVGCEGVAVGVSGFGVPAAFGGEAEDGSVVEAVIDLGGGPSFDTVRAGERVGESVSGRRAAPELRGSCPVLHGFCGRRGDQRKRRRAECRRALEWIEQRICPLRVSWRRYCGVAVIGTGAFFGVLTYPVILFLSTVQTTSS